MDCWLPKLKEETITGNTTETFVKRSCITSKAPSLLRLNEEAGEKVAENLSHLLFTVWTTNRREESDYQDTTPLGGLDCDALRFPQKGDYN